MIIAIDGPCGVGKSTIAGEVAKRLGFSCLDTGAMFRTVALLALQNGAQLDDDERLGALASESDIEFGYIDDDPSPSIVIADGVDVTRAIRTFEIDNAVTPVCQQQSVREALLHKQQRMCRKGDYVVDGRDTGTVAFPDAEVKIYLDADAGERARRRVRQNEERGKGSTDYDEVLADMQRRDYEDMHRELAPLTRAEDAIYIDSTDMDMESVVKMICSIAQMEKLRVGSNAGK